MSSSSEVREQGCKALEQYNGSEPVIQEQSKRTRHRSENGVQVL